VLDRGLLWLEVEGFYAKFLERRAGWDFWAVVGLAAPRAVMLRLGPDLGRWAESRVHGPFPFPSIFIVFLFPKLAITCNFDI
jgi:hypothetical protein